jgi:hypothetical protein
VATAADTATFVKWAQIGAKRFPQNVTLLKNVNKAYSFSGQVDSSLAVTRRLLAADTTDVTPALAAAQALIDDLKSTVPIWKEQHLTSGEVTWVGLP